MLDALALRPRGPDPRDPDRRESNRDYYLRRAHEETAAAERCACPIASEKHRELARLLLSIAGDHGPGSVPPGMDRATLASLKPGLVVLSGSAA